MKKIFIVLPSLNPDIRLVKLIQELIIKGLNNIIVVNDGSKEKCQEYFDKAKELGAIILTHYINMGKGRALKTAFNYLLNEYGEDIAVVCADSDGQHIVEDILRLKDEVQNNDSSLIIGCRNFSNNIPFRSRFGNKLTIQVFKLLCGVSVSDTQTGLRALSGKLMKAFLNTKGERFEYEMNMLIETKEKQIPIKEIPISTIYIDKNETSHFNPIKDSFRIYSVFLKFMVSSSFSFLVDISLFALCMKLFHGIFQKPFDIGVSTAIARIISSFINYTINKNRVFHLNETKSKTIIKYYCLCTVQMACSALFVYLVTFILPINETMIKLIVDFVLFVISFQIQREWVFKKNK